MNLIVLSFVIIACFWVAERLLYYLTSKPMNTAILTNIARELIKDYEGHPSPEYAEKINVAANKNGLVITFFSAPDADDYIDFDYDEEYKDENKDTVRALDTYVIYSVSAFSDGTPYGKPLVWNDEQLEAFFERHIFRGDKEFSYSLNSPPVRVYGAKFEFTQYNTTNTIFVCIEAYRSTSGIQLSVTLIQLLVASLACILLAVLLSLVYSRQFSDPIVEFSKAAELLAKGKYDDIKFRKWGINEIDSLADSLSHAAEEIKKTDEFRREFLANITHDLRTPITMMRGYAEMIRDISGENKAKRTAHSQIIIDESERLSLLVEDVLLMSKLDSGTLKLTKTVFNVSTLVATVVERFKIKSILEGYKFHLDLDKSLTVCADMQRIEQVLYNLIANAITYAGNKKEVFVTVLKTADAACRVEIRDSGEGIPADELELIWDRYYRVNQKNRKVIGNGIGLNIVKGILESHNAKFGAESLVGLGTVFWFKL